MSRLLTTQFSGHLVWLILKSTFLSCYQVSFLQLEETKTIFESMHIIQTESGKRILLDLVIQNQDELYHPSKSNFEAARSASVRLHRSLHKKGQFQSFQSEIEKGIGEKQLR